ncbi:hypothetical protein GCM10009549_27150 [Streptomyces thermoalcalitolerans]|uniref:Uncharacterized protein n=1 Tax=Streptomyces thermoalcalitolerans TaxID=65605 RepID=A0ABN1NPG5_9ACTN
MGTPWAVYNDWWLRQHQRRVDKRKAREFEERTGHRDWGDDSFGTAPVQLDLDVGPYTDARRLSTAGRAGSGLPGEETSAWCGVNSEQTADGGVGATLGSSLRPGLHDREVRGVMFFLPDSVKLVKVMGSVP